MKVQLGTFETTAAIAATKKDEVKQPKYHCNTCGRQCDNHCSFFNRHVEADCNRCFNHTSYNSAVAQLKYVSPPDSYFQEIQKEEEPKGLSRIA